MYVFLYHMHAHEQQKFQVYTMLQRWLVGRTAPALAETFVLAGFSLTCLKLGLECQFRGGEGWSKSQTVLEASFKRAGSTWKTHALKIKRLSTAACAKQMF